VSLQDDIQGHWIRDWIKAPGFEDHTTRVHWAQVGPDYADVRVPIDRPDLARADALDGLAASDLLTLVRAEGFAGHVTLDGTQCTWHREISFHGTPGTPDVGTISFDPQGRMIEIGVHADYTELWDRRSGTGSRAIRCSGDGYYGLVVTIGEACVVGIGRRNAPATAPLVAALRAGRVPDGIADMFDGLHAVGHWSDREFVADLATQPFAEGRIALTLEDGGVIWHRIGFDGASTDIPLQIETDAA